MCNMDSVFIKEIIENMKAQLMESEIQDFPDFLPEGDIRREYLRNFELFEEFNGKSTSEIYKERCIGFNHVSFQAKKQVEQEIQDFSDWLVEVKGFNPNTAHYYAASLKSLLLGLPVGIEIGLLFGIILHTGVDNHV
jgi:hypothetical protein